MKEGQGWSHQKFFSPTPLCFSKKKNRKFCRCILNGTTYLKGRLQWRHTSACAWDQANPLQFSNFEDCQLIDSCPNPISFSPFLEVTYAIQLPRLFISIDSCIFLKLFNLTNNLNYTIEYTFSKFFNQKLDFCQFIIIQIFLHPSKLQKKKIIQVE